MNARWNSFVAGRCVVLLTLVIGACAAPGPIPAITQPALSAMAQPYADGLRKAGINSVQVFGNGARVRMATSFGEIYLRYPSGLSATAFAVYVDPATVEVDSDTFNAGNSAQYEAAVKAILPAAIKSATENNTRVIENRFGRN
jgi:hypothetical protein